MNRLLQFIHDNHVVVAAVVLFLAVLVHCLFTGTTLFGAMSDMLRSSSTI